jgi:hypothetical protein
MGRRQKTEEEKKATKAAQNQRYYSRHKETIIEKAKARKSIQERHYDAEQYGTQKVRRNRNALERLHSVSHSYIQPITMALTEMGIADKLYKAEMELVEEIFAMLNAYFIQNFH